MISFCEVGTFLPTKSAWIGSSRWPRSIEHGELHGPRAAEVDQLVERGPHGAAGIEDVVAEDHHAVVDRARQVGALDLRLGADGREVVAIESDVEDADGDLDRLQALDLGGDLLGERDAAGADADQEDGPEVAVMALDDLSDHATDDPSHLLGVEDRRLGRQVFRHAGETSRSAASYAGDRGLSTKGVGFPARAITPPAVSTSRIALHRVFH